MQITRSASLEIIFAALVPVTPTAPRLWLRFHGIAPLPACVSPTGTPVLLQNSFRAFSAPEYLTPPPAIITGLAAYLIIAAALAKESSDGILRGRAQTRLLKN